MLTTTHDPASHPSPRRLICGALLLALWRGASAEEVRSLDASPEELELAVRGCNLLRWLVDGKGVRP